MMEVKLHTFLTFALDARAFTTGYFGLFFFFHKIVLLKPFEVVSRVIFFTSSRKIFVLTF